MLSYKEHEFGGSYTLSRNEKQEFKNGSSMPDLLLCLLVDIRDHIKRNRERWVRLLLEMLSLFPDPFSVFSYWDPTYLCSFHRHLYADNSPIYISNLILSWVEVPCPQRIQSISAAYLSVTSIQYVWNKTHDLLSQTDTHSGLAYFFYW